MPLAEMAFLCFSVIDFLIYVKLFIVIVKCDSTGLTAYNN